MLKISNTCKNAAQSGAAFFVKNFNIPMLAIVTGLSWRKSG